MISNKKDHTPAEQLTAVMTRIYNEWLTTPSGGNLSILDDDQALWVTPSQVDKGCLSPESMVRIAKDGSWSSSYKPTSEWPFHRAVLEARTDCRAVAHAHPTSLVAFSVIGKELSLNQFPDLCRWINRVAFSPYAIPGSKQLGENLRTTFLSGCDATMMENHGAVACGRDIHEAFQRLDLMEHLATILLGGARLGQLKPLSDDQMSDARKRMNREWDSITVDISSQRVAREELAEFIRRAHGRGLLSSKGGVFSRRCGKGFLIMPDDSDNAVVQGCDLVYVEGERCETGKVPSAMIPIHSAVYEAHSYIESMTSALPSNLMAFAASGVQFDARTIPEAYIFLKSVPTLPFEARFNGAYVADAINPKTPVALIENSCAVVTGASVFSVFDRLEVADFTARSVLDAGSIGRLKPMPDDVLEEICRVYNC
jgi:L-fuculose-phosphate aldolase